MTISFSGLASGLDTSSWVESLVALKQAKIDTLEEEKETVLLSQETLNNIKSFFSSFRNVIEKITDAQFGIPTMDLFAQNIATSANLDVLTATATTDAEEAEYNVLVNQLATNTAANSNFSYMTTIVQTTTASADSKLINLGIKAGNIGVTVNGVERGITITENDTIQSFIDKLNAIGVNASYNEKTGLFSMDIDANDINDIDNTGVIQGFHLEGVNEGYESDSLKTSSTDTVFSAATEDTLLSELGVNNGVITVEANDTNYNITINSNSTLGTLIQDFENINIEASLSEDGYFIIQDAKITNEGATNFTDALGLEFDVFSNTQTSGDLSHETIITQVTTATSDTLLSELGDGINITNGQTVILKNSNNEYSTITVGTSTTLGMLLEDMTNAGLYAVLNDDGTVEISGGTITGGTFDAISALGLKVEPFSAMTTGKPLTETVQHAEIVTLDTMLVDDLKVRAGYLEVTDADGNKFYEKIYHGQTLGDFMADLGNLGIYTKLRDDGVLEITGGAFATLSDDRVNELIADGTIRETDARYMQGTDILTCLYGAPVISTDQITVASTYSKTQALTHQVTNTINASLTTTLGNLGLSGNGSAIFNVRGENRTINVTQADDIQTLINKLQDIGIQASWNEDNHRLTIENATINGGSSNLDDVLSLTETLSGKYVTSDALSRKDTITIDATEDTRLAEFGISNSMSAADRTVNLYYSDGSLAGSITVNENTTIGNLIDFINQHNNISAYIKDGTFIIDNGYIQNATLETNMGLDTENKSSFAIGSVMTVTTTAAVTGDTTLGDIIDTLGTNSAVQSGYTLRFNSKELNVSENTTLNELIDMVHQNGGTAFIDATGRLTITGGTLAGTVASALGISSITTTDSVSATGNTLWTTQEVFADLNTKMSDLGFTANSTIIINDKLNNPISTINISTSQTIEDVFNILKNNGIDGNIANGVISLTSPEGNFITGSWANMLGITTHTSTEIVNTTTASTAAVLYSGTVVADETSVIDTIVDITSSNNRLTVYDSENNIVGTITVNTSTTLDELFKELANYNISAQINDGRIYFSSVEGNYVTGQLINQFGMSPTSVVVTTTVGKTSTSSAAISYTITNNATIDTTLSQVGINRTNTIVVHKSDGTTTNVTIANSQTIGGLFDSLDNFGIQGIISNGVISLTSADGAYLTDAAGSSLLSTLGITTQSYTQTITVGTENTSAGVITYEQTHVADKHTTFADLGIGDSNILVYDNSNSAIARIMTTSEMTLDELFKELAVYGVDAEINDGVISIFSPDGNYVDGYLATALGIQTQEVVTSSTVGTVNTSSSTITYSERHYADFYTRLGQLGILSSSLQVYDEKGNRVGVLNYSNSDTIGSFIGSLESYGITGTISDGVILLNSDTGYTIGGQLASSLGIDRMYVAAGESYTVTHISTQTATIGGIMTGSSVNVYKDATRDTTFSELGISGSGYTIYTRSGAVALNSNLSGTIGDWFDTLESYGIQGTISDGVITLSSGRGFAVRSNALGIEYFSEQQTVSVTTSSTTPVTITITSTGTNQIIVNGNVTVSGSVTGPNIVTLTIPTTTTSVTGSTTTQTIEVTQTITIPATSSTTGISMTTGNLQNRVVTQEYYQMAFTMLTGPSGHALFVGAGGSLVFRHKTEDRYETVNFRATDFIETFANTIQSYIGTLTYTEGAGWERDYTLANDNGDWILYDAGIFDDEWEAGSGRNVSMSIAHGSRLVTTHVEATSSDTFNHIVGGNNKTLSSSQTMTIRVNGSNVLVQIGPSDSISDFCDRVSSVTGGAMTATFSGGRITFNPVGDAYIYDMSSTLSSYLGINTGEGVSYVSGGQEAQTIVQTTTQTVITGGTTTIAVPSTEVIIFTINLSGTSGATGGGSMDGHNTITVAGSTTITITSTGTGSGVINYNWNSNSDELQYHTYQSGSTTIGASGTIGVMKDGTAYSINVSADNTVDEVLTALAGYGISAEIASGAIRLQGTEGAWVTSINGGLSSAIGLSGSMGYSTVTTTTTIVSTGSVTENVWFNTNSEMQFYNTTETMTSSTTLGELGVNTSQSISVNYEGKDYTLNFGNSNTIGDIISGLAGLGVSGVINAGRLVLNGTSNGYITNISNSLLNALALRAAGNGNTWTSSTHTSITNTTSANQSYRNTHTMTAGDTLGSLGMSGNGTITVNYEGQYHAVTFSSASTVDDIISALGGLGIAGSVMNGQLTLAGTNDGYITAISSNIQTALKLKAAGNGNTWTTSVETHYYNSDSNEQHFTATETINIDSTFAQLGMTSNGTINVNYEGRNYTVTVEASDTVDDILNALAGLGISGSIQNGRLSLTGTDNGYITSMSSNVQNALKLQVGLNNSYTTSTDTIFNNTTSDELESVRDDIILTGDTVLSSINGFNNGNGRLVIHQTDGRFVTITVNASDTLSEFFTQISQYGLVGNVDSEGKVSIEGIGNVYMQAVSGGTNLLTALNLSNVIYNVQTVTVNRTSNVLSQTITAAATGTTQLGNLMDSSGNTMGSGNGTIVLQTTSDAGNQHITLTFSRTQTLYDVIDKLAEYGIQASIDSTGRFSISSSTLKDFDISGNLGELLMGAYDKNYGTSDTYNISTNLIQTTVGPMTPDTLLSNYGITGGNILITQQGVNYTVNVDTTQLRTVSDFMNFLAQYGFDSQIDAEGRLVVTGIGESYLSSISGGSNILDVFGLTDWDMGSVSQSSDHLSDKETIVQETTLDTKLNELTDAAGNNLGITSGNIYVYQDGTRYLVNINNNDTLQTLAAKLSQYGISMELSSDGRLYFEGNNNSYMTTDGIASGASNILQQLNVLNNWSERYDSTSDNLSYTVEVDDVVTGSTKLSDLQDASGNNLGITEGSFYIYNNGVRNTETITADMTVNDLKAMLAEHGLIVDISENGQISVGAYGNTYLATSALSGQNSNLVSTLFAEWDFVNIYTSNNIEIPKDVIQAVTRDTKLSDINEGTYQPGYITVVKDGVQTNIELTADDTIGTLMDELALYGFESVLNENGQLIIKNSGNSLLQNYTGPGQASNALELLGIDLNNWIQTNTYESSTLNVITTNTIDAAVTLDTELSLLGVTTGEYFIFNNGVKYTAYISTGETLGSFLETLKSFGIETSLVSDGDSSILTIKGNGDSYITKSTSTTNASNVVEQLFGDLSHDSSYQYSGLEETSEIVTNIASATEDTLLSYFDRPWGTTTLKAEGKLSVTVNDETAVIDITADETFGSLIDKFEALGLEASISSDGQLMIQSGFDTFTINNDGTTSSLLATIGLKYNDDLGGFVASSVTSEATTTSIEEKTLSVANYAGYDTKMGLLNISDGTLSIYRNGEKATIDVHSDETFAQFRARIASAFADVDITFEDGYLKFFSKDGNAIEVGATTDTSNFSAITGLTSDGSGTVKSSRELYSVNSDSVITGTGIFRKGDVTEGTFIIGNATFSITNTTTLANLISQINSSDEANATAYWDSIQGKFVITSRTTGSALVNIEAGTSNFTDIMGYTNTTWQADGSVDSTKMNVNTQEVGKNAMFTINGTSYTSSSNTITSDISRIKGVTLNLKGLTEGESVKVTVERDKETLASAVSDIVDAYNELISNVDEAIAIDGELHDQSLLKLIRNQLRTMMTASDAGTTIFRNLDAIGISVDSASANNIATEGITELTFDKDKFIQAFEADQDAVKALLIGSDSNTGVFTKIEDLVESTLQSVTGYFATADDAYQREIDSIDNKIEKQQRALERYRAQLEAKFASMDILIANMQQQYSSFLVT